MSGKFARQFYVFELFFLIIISALQAQNEASIAEDNNSQTVLHLLNVLPFPDNRSFAGWDRAYELIPASELAMEQINNRTDILPGYRLEIINVDSEACGIRVISNGLVNTYTSLLDRNLTIAGIVGLFCSSVTEAIAPLLARYPFDYVTVAGSTSAEHRDVAKYPRLHHAISSANDFSNAVIKLMEEFDWKRISVIQDSASAYHASSAYYFVTRVVSKKFELITNTAVTPGLVSQVIPLLREDKSKIVYSHISGTEAASLMCEAYKSSSTWPAYVYIFHDRVVSDFINSTTSCTPQEMIAAIEGIFMLRYQLVLHPNLTLVSGVTYKDYYKQYLQKLNQTEMELNVTLNQKNVYANVAYDEVWSLALALNNSLETLKLYNMSFEQYRQIEKRTQITDIVQNHLLELRFQGAASLVDFDLDHETGTLVEIYQVVNGTDVLVGIYNPQLNETNALTILPTLNKEDIPGDTFESVQHQIHTPVLVLITLLTILCYGFTTFNLLLLFVYRNNPSIKAFSPFLSILMFVGCYLIYTTILLRNSVSGLFVFTVVCNIEYWCLFNGLNLIFATTFLRLLRLRHVFKAYGKTGKYWSDKYLILGILIILSIGDVILVLWTGIDTVHKRISSKYIANAHPPYFEVRSSCYSNNLLIWMLISFGYSMLILMLAVFMAVMTRHIKLSNFKDTKKINAYAFASVGILCFGVPTSFILHNISDIGEQITISLSLLMVGVLCQAFIFAPKTFPLLFCKRQQQRRMQKTRRESQFALTEVSTISNDV